MAGYNLAELRASVEALEVEAADGVNAKLIGRIADLRVALNVAQSEVKTEREHTQCNNLLARLKHVYAP